MKKRFNFNIIFLSILMLITSCRTNKVPEGEYLLVSNKFTYKDHQKRKPFEAELPEYVTQKTNGAILMYIPFSLWIYGISNKKYDTVFTDYYQYSPKKRNQDLLDSLYVKNNLSEEIGKSKWIDRFLFRNGEAPALVEEELSAKSARNLEQYFKKRGWMNAKVDDSLIIKKNTKKAIVDYKIELGRPTRIDTIIYDIPDHNVSILYNKYIPYSMLKPKRRLDAFSIEKDINRMEIMMRDRGFYNFNEYGDEIKYIADTTNGSLRIPLTIQIKKSPLLVKDSTDIRFKQYTYEKIAIILGKDVRDAYSLQRKFINDSLDGLTYEDNYYLFNNREDYKNRVLKDMLAIEEGDIYSTTNDNNTRRNINKFNNFNILDFNISPAKDSDSTLISRIVLYPKKKYDYELGFEGFAAENTFGVTPKIDFTIKNLLGGGENLDLGFYGTLGNVETSDSKDKLFNSSEIAFQAGLTFPRWLLPFNLDRIVSKKYVPTSSINLGVSAQYNIGLDRRNYMGSIDYKMTPKPAINHKFTLWNIQYTQYLKPERYFNMYGADKAVRDALYKNYSQYNNDFGKPQLDTNLSDKNKSVIIMKDKDYIDYLQNINADLYEKYNLVQLRQFRFTQDILISSFLYNFVFDERMDRSVSNPFYFSSGIELAGNVLSLFNGAMSSTPVGNNKTSHTIFDVPYSQFAKIDLDFRKYFTFNRKTLATRLFFGIGIPYGNSNTMPFNRNYSMGGANDVRAWRAYGLGPGNSDLGTKDGFELTALGNVKLLTSIEYRFNMNKSFEGAFFVDAGNIWSTSDDNPYKFKINDFYKELGIGGGFGVRYSISYFTLRFDFAYKLHDPRGDEKWVLDKIKPLKPQIQFAIGYPF